jgi:DNA-binding response OmpR family regulator
MVRILVCEDDPDIRYFLKRQLEEAGHEVIDAPDGDAGFGAFSVNDIHLVITDMMMPEFSGADLVSTLNLIDDAPPVIVVTAYGNDERTRMLAKDPCVVAILGKPWDRDHLLKLVANHARA